jgi:sugar phosphate isomerase/epimerase
MGGGRRREAIAVKLGLLTAAFPSTPLAEIAGWAAANGFNCLEVACWPNVEGPTRRYGGVCHIDCASLTDDQAQQIVGDLGERGITISGLGYYPNPLAGDLDVRAAAVSHLRAVIAAAPKLGVAVVNTFIGNDQHRPYRENVAELTTVWPDIVSHAVDHGVRIAIENCPMIFSEGEWPGGNNLMHSPAAWRDVFELLEGDTIGLNLDPSHLVWQMIDYERVVREFGPRIYHVHAKDMEIDRNGLYEHGVLSAGIGWQVPRLPGLGEIQWDRFIAALYQAGYDHAVVVEHEDRRFEGSDERVKAGFLLARNAVAPFIA